MDQIGVRELRQNASVYLDRVKRGESIEVTERGVPVAILSPTPTGSLLDRLVVEGRLTPAEADFHDWLDDPLPANVDGAPTLSESLAALRDEEDR